MTDNNITKDDVVDTVHRTKELQDTIDELKSEIETLSDQNPDVPEEKIHDAVNDEARQGAADFLDHLANETCETEECNELRDMFGLEPGETADDDGADDDGSDDATTTPTDDGTETAEAEEEEGEESEGSGRGNSVDPDFDSDEYAAFPDEL